MSDIPFYVDKSSGRPFNFLSAGALEGMSPYRLPVTVSTVHKTVLAGEKLSKFRGAEGLGWFDSAPVSRVNNGWITTYQPFPDTLFYLRPPAVDEDPETGAIVMGPTSVLDYGRRSAMKYMKLVGMRKLHGRRHWVGRPSKIADDVWYYQNSALPDGAAEGTPDDADVGMWTSFYYHHTKLIQRILYRRMLFLQNCCFEKEGEDSYRFVCKGDKRWLAPHGSSSGELPDIREIRARPFQVTGDIPLIAKYPKAFEDAKEDGHVMSWIASDKDSPVCAYHVNQNPEEWITRLCYRFHSSLGQMRSQPKSYDASIMRHVVETAMSGNAPWQWFHESGPFGDEDSQIENKLIYRVCIPDKNPGGDPGETWYYDSVPPLSGYVQREVEAYLARHGYSPFSVRYWRPVPTAPVNGSLEAEVMGALSGAGLYFKHPNEQTGHVGSERIGTLALLSECEDDESDEEIGHLVHAECRKAMEEGCAFDLMLQICAHDNVEFSIAPSEYGVNYTEYSNGEWGAVWTGLQTHCGDPPDHVHDQHIGAGCYNWQKNVTHNVNFEVVPHVRLFTRLPPRMPVSAQSDSGGGGGGEEGGQA